MRLVSQHPLDPGCLKDGHLSAALQKETAVNQREDRNAETPPCNMQLTVVDLQQSLLHGFAGHFNPFHFNHGKATPTGNSRIA